VRGLEQLYIYDLAGDRWNVETDGTFGTPAWHRRFGTRAERRGAALLASRDQALRGR